MTDRRIGGLLLVLGILGVLALVAVPGDTGVYHAGDGLICYDCHTAHFSEEQGKAPNDPFGTGTAPLYPLTGAGPYPYMLRQPQNLICLSCHDGKVGAPDVLGANFNAAPTVGRQAGALNDTTGTAPYEIWKGHTLYSTDPPPGYNPTAVGLGNWYNGTTWGLKCIHCHEMHATPEPYRNLGPVAMGGTIANFQPTYVTDTTNDTTKDVWINIPAGYAGASGNPATFNPYYDAANIMFNRNDATVGASKTSNKLDTFCAACHGNFHGGPGDAANVGATPGVLDGFIRHPTAQTVIGAAGAQGYGGHSSLTRYTGATTKVKVYANDRAAYTDATPGCVSCHKAHGNQNPYGLIFLSRTATSVGEEGGWGATEAHTTMQAYRNLCGQCHGQGN